MSEQRLRGYGIFPNPHRSCGRRTFETHCAPHLVLYVKRLFFQNALYSMSIRFHSRNRKYYRHLKQNDLSIGIGKLREYQADKAITQKLVTVIVEVAITSLSGITKGRGNAMRT